MMSQVHIGPGMMTTSSKSRARLDTHSKGSSPPGGRLRGPGRALGDGRPHPAILMVVVMMVEAVVMAGGSGGGEGVVYHFSA